MLAPVPQNGIMNSRLASPIASAGEAHGKSGASVDRTTAPIVTSFVTRSGCVAAIRNASGAPSDAPNTTARSEPAASITARTSSTRCSSVGTSVTGSDRPMPRLSNRMTRENRASRSKSRANAGLSQVSSTCERKPATKTTSCSPSPTTW